MNRQAQGAVVTVFALGLLCLAIVACSSGGGGGGGSRGVLGQATLVEDEVGPGAPFAAGDSTAYYTFEYPASASELHLAAWNNGVPSIPIPLPCNLGVYMGQPLDVTASSSYAAGMNVSLCVFNWDYMTLSTAGLSSTTHAVTVAVHDRDGSDDVPFRLVSSYAPAEPDRYEPSDATPTVLALGRTVFPDGSVLYSTPSITGLTIGGERPVEPSCS